MFRSLSDTGDPPTMVSLLQRSSDQLLVKRSSNQNPFHCALDQDNTNMFRGLALTSHVLSSTNTSRNFQISLGEKNS